MSLPLRRSFLIVSALSLVAGCSHTEPAPTHAAPPPVATAPTPAAPRESPPLLQLPEDVHPLHYAIDLAVDPDADTFSGVEDIDVQLDHPRQVIWLHGRELNVTGASIRTDHGTIGARYAQVDRTGVVSVTADRAVGPGKVTLHFTWKRPWNENTLGLYRAQEDHRWYAFTQFESIYARRAFPSFDEPRFKTPFDVTLEVPAGSVAIGNAPVAAQTKLADGREQVRFQTTPPLPTYLVAVAVGPFDVVDGPTLPPNAIRSRPLPTRGLAPKGRGKELAFALKAGAELLAEEEQYFGIPYPYAKLDHIAVPDFEAGAMENAGAITYREQVLLYQPGITPPSVRQHIAVDMAHEMAHQWFGDLVTMPWWTDTWLNESFATWMENRAVAGWNPSLGPVREEFLGWLNGAMHEDSLASARAIRQPLTNTDAISDQFDGITYAKGAAVLAMFERWMGEEKFRQGIHDYLTAHAWGSGSTDDLLHAFSKAAGRDVVAPFHTFLDQPGIPLVAANLSCEGGKASLALKQSRFVPAGSHVDGAQQWQIPVCVRYGQRTGPAREACTLLTEPSATLALEGGCPAWVYPNAEASGYYRWSLDSASLAKLRGPALAKLSPIERVSFAQNLGAAVSANAIPYADALADVAPMAGESDPNTATAAMGLIEYARQRLVPESLRPKVDAYGRALYRPVWKKLGWTPGKDEPATRHQLRADVLGFLALDVRDPGVRAEAARRGLAYAGLKDGKFHPEAVAPELAGAALSVAVQEKGAPLFDALEARLGSIDDGILRGRVISALASVRDPALSQRALALTVDPRLRTNERWLPLMNQLGAPETRDRAWQYAQAAFEKILPLLSTGARRHVPRIGGAFCDASHEEAVRGFFSARMKDLPGAERALAQTLESIHLCATEAQLQSPSAVAFFSRK